MAVHPVEIDAGGGGDAGFRQHAPAEALAVIGEMPDIGIEVEGAVGRGEAREAGLGQLGQKQVAIAPIDGDPLASSSGRQPKTASAAICGKVGAEMKRFWARHSTARARSAGTSIQPRRQPVMEKYFEKLLTTMAVSSREAALTVSAP